MRVLDVKRFLLLMLILPFAVAGILAGQTAKQPNVVSWDRFRGPNGTGTSDDKDVPLTFGPTENVIWKVALPGGGNSSPIIWGNHLFLQSAGSDGKQRSLQT